MSASEESGAPAAPDAAAASSTAVRPDMVQKAVQFMQNPKVQDSPLSEKTKFLEAKGLRGSEIQAAMMQVSGGGGVAGAGGAPAGQAGGMAMAEQGPGWGWKEYFITGTVVLGAAVVAKDYLLPYVRWPWSSTNDKLDTLTESIKDMQEDMKETLDALKKSTEQHNTDMLTVNRRVSTLEKSPNEAITRDLSSIKSMLLNPRQFASPTIPKVPSTAIPQWQRRQHTIPGAASAQTAQPSASSAVPQSPAASTNTATAPAPVVAATPAPVIAATPVVASAGAGLAVTAATDAADTSSTADSAAPAATAAAAVVPATPATPEQAQVVAPEPGTPVQPAAASAQASAGTPQ